MRCEECYGTGYDVVNQPHEDPFYHFACPECGGTGIAHCCDGLQAQEAPHPIREGSPL